MNRPVKQSIFFVVQNPSDGGTQSPNDSNADEVSTQHFQNVIINVAMLARDTHSSPDTELPVIVVIRNGHEVPVSESLDLPDLELPKSLNDIVQYRIRFCRQNQITNSVDHLKLRIVTHPLRGKPHL